MPKYDGLGRDLQALTADSVTLSFDDISKTIGADL
jgi:hypothetical protein